MKILITGVAGFIGSNLAESLLASGFDIIGLDNFDNYYERTIKESNLKNLLGVSNFIFFERDISRPIDLHGIHSVDAIIHLAAKAGVRPSLVSSSLYIETNVLGTDNVVKLARDLRVKKFIFASSSSVYGQNVEIPFSESASTDSCISPYAFTKKAGEVMLYTYHLLYQIDVICLRFFTVYGPRQRPDLAINKFVTSIWEGNPITLFGDGSTSRDYTFIGDIVKGIMGALNYLNKTSSVYEIINLGNSNPISLFDMLGTIERIMGKTAVVTYLPMQPGDVTLTCADISRARNLLGYQPEVSFEDGIRRYCEWRGIIQT